MRAWGGAQKWCLEGRGHRERCAIEYDTYIHTPPRDDEMCMIQYICVAGPLLPLGGKGVSIFRAHACLALCNNGPMR